MGGAFGSLMSGVKNLLPAHTDCSVTRLVDGVMKGAEAAEEFVTLDPKSMRTQADGRRTPSKHETIYNDNEGGKKTPGMPFTMKSEMTGPAELFDDAIVFLVGGGNYVEYQNVQEFSSVIRKSFFFTSATQWQKESCVWRYGYCDPHFVLGPAAAIRCQINHEMRMAFDGQMSVWTGLFI